MKSVLRPQGILVLNCFGDLEPGRDYFTASLHKTMRTVFGGVVIHNAHNGGNVFFVASPQTDLRLLHTPNLAGVHPSAREDVRVAFTRTIGTNPDNGRVLTDDYNPVEYYDAANRERFRRGLVGMVQEF